jgi:aspartyl-tRNA(Asn)/glutamyl-tRNA(Gln) amidotransferase subunit A
VEAVRHYIAQIEEQKHLNAWLEVYEDEALAQAEQTDHNIKTNGITGKLQGVIVGLKDVISFSGHHLSASSKILGGFTSIFNATTTQRLLDDGAIIIGRQNCDEFAMGGSNENSAFGPVKNAADNSRVPGGSSGGSAVGVQAGMCMISLGSDTGGSVRQPADFCGIVGLKPTYGRVSRHGLIAYASSFDQIGIFSKTVDDAALTLGVIAGPDEFDSTVSHNAPSLTNIEANGRTAPYRIAYLKSALQHPSLDPEIAASILAFTKKLTSAGHMVEPVDFKLIDHIVPTYYVLTTAEASSNLARYDGVKFGFRKNTTTADLTTFYKENRSEGFGAEVKRRILLGTFVLSSGYYDAYFAKAQQVRQLLKNNTAEIFEKYDAIILPTVPTPAFRIGEKNDDPIAMFLGDIYTVYANLVGNPAISLPLFTHSSNLPFGLQVMCSPFNELLLHRLSKMMVNINEG